MKSNASSQFLKTILILDLKIFVRFGKKAMPEFSSGYGIGVLVEAAGEATTTWQLASSSGCWAISLGVQSRASVWYLELALPLAGQETILELYAKLANPLPCREMAVAIYLPVWKTLDLNLDPAVCVSCSMTALE